MTSWKAYLIFDDKIHDKETKLKITFPPLYTYKCLYNNLKSFFHIIGWDPIDYPPNHITFKLASYMEEPTRVVDWNKFILSRDEIHIVIFNPNSHYYALFTQQGEKLIQTTKADTIYNDIKIEHVKEPLLLYKINESGTKIKLIDVIDNPMRMYNKVVKRLIHRYGW